MKLNIKTLAASLLVGLSLVSCNNDFDEDGGKTTYPAKGELCSWSRDYTAASNTSYLLNLYVNEEGDTLADLSIFNPVSERSNVMNGGKVSYDSKTGVYNINYDESIYGKALISVADFGNKKGVVNIYTVNENKDGKVTYAAVDKFNAVATDTISVLGQWSIGNGEDVTLYVNGNATFTQNGQTVAQGSYQFDGKSGAITTTDGKSYQIVSCRLRSTVNLTPLYKCLPSTLTTGKQLLRATSLCLCSISLAAASPSTTLNAVANTDLTMVNYLTLKTLQSRSTGTEQRVPSTF